MGDYAVALEIEKLVASTRESNRLNRKMVESLKKVASALEGIERCALAEKRRRELTL